MLVGVAASYIFGVGIIASFILGMVIMGLIIRSKL